jgi:hypothetical protein
MYRIFAFALLLTFFGCSLQEDTTAGFSIYTEIFDFTDSQQGWDHGFAEYPSGPDDSAFYELKYSYTEEPSSLKAGRKSIMLSGNNHSDDLFMFIKKKITDLKPNTNYTLTFDVELVSDTKAGMVGIGGTPGENVFLKVGATATEPKSVIEKDHYVMNIEKGNQREDGEDMIFIGDLATNAPGYPTITRSNSVYNDHPLVVKSNSKGELWLIVGTDSGFEGTTTLYYTKIDVVFSVSN